MAIKKEETHAFTVKFPKSLTEEIDQICANNFITRTSWLIHAARDYLERERSAKVDKMLKTIANKEQ